MSFGPLGKAEKRGVIFSGVLVCDGIKDFQVVNDVVCWIWGDEVWAGDYDCRISNYIVDVFQWHWDDIGWRRYVEELNLEQGSCVRLMVRENAGNLDVINSAMGWVWSLSLEVKSCILKINCFPNTWAWRNERIWASPVPKVENVCALTRIKDEEGHLVGLRRVVNDVSLVGENLSCHLLIAAIIVCCVKFSL